MTATLFGASPTISAPDNAEDTYSMGTRVTFAVAGQIVGARIWGATNAVTSSPSAAVYTTGAVQQTVKALSGYNTAAWTTVTFDTPVSVLAGETYDIVFGPINRYAANASTFPLTVGDLTGVKGRFIATGSLAWPTNDSGGSGSTWYGIDVLFDAAPSFTGTLAATTAAPAAAFAGTVEADGQLAAVTAAPTASFAGSLALAGALAGTTTLPIAAVAGFVEADGTGLNIAAVMQTLADQLDTIPGLRVYAYPPGALVPPAAVVAYPEEIVFDETYGRGMDTMTLSVVVVVGKATARTTPARLGQYANSDGTKSVKAVLEAGTYTAFEELRVERAVFDAVSIGGTEYMAALFSIEVAGSGGG